MKLQPVSINIVAILNIHNCVVPPNQTQTTPTDTLTFAIFLVLSTSGYLRQGTVSLLIYIYNFVLVDWRDCSYIAGSGEVHSNCKIQSYLHTSHA